MHGDLQVVSHQYGQAEYWEFLFVGGRAVYTINETTGEFSIQSDWGDFSHRWNPDHTGYPTLREFIASCSPSYVMGKFSYNLSRGDTDVFDAEGTRAAIRREICRERRASRITREQAREGWDDLDSLLEELDADYVGETVAIMLWQQWPESLRWMGEAWEFFKYDRSARYLFCQDQLVPFFQNFLREQGPALNPTTRSTLESDRVSTC